MGGINTNFIISSNWHNLSIDNLKLLCDLIEDIDNWWDFSELKERNYEGEVMSKEIEWTRKWTLSRFMSIFRL